MKTFSRILPIIFYAMLTLIVAAGCTPQQRLTRLLSKNPELMEVKTIAWDTTIATRPISFDTTFTLRDQQTKTIRDSASGVILTINRQEDEISIDIEKKADSLPVNFRHDYTIVNHETQQAIKRNITWKIILRYSLIIVGLLVLINQLKRLVNGK